MAEGKAMRVSSKGYWPAGVEASELEYAKFAKLFEQTSLSKCTNSIVVLAMYLNVPCSTVKERVRRSRRLGLLTQPGKGKFAQTFITDKCKQILKENE
jgi:hypothetical protein